MRLLPKGQAEEIWEYSKKKKPLFRKSGSTGEKRNFMLHIPGIHVCWILTL
jgi:hypothetical protein